MSILTNNKINETSEAFALFSFFMLTVEAVKLIINCSFFNNIT